MGVLGGNHAGFNGPPRKEDGKGGIALEFRGLNA